MVIRSEVKLIHKQTEIGNIPEDWIVSTLEEISQRVTDGSHFSPKEMHLGKKIIATVKDMRYNGFDFTNSKRISDEDYSKLVRNGCSPKRGDIIISKDGANCLDLIFIYDQNGEIVLLSSIAIVTLKTGYNPYFYRYYLLSPTAQKIMREGFVTGSAIPRVILKNFKKIPVPIPPNLETQSKIANILRTLDLKIDVNAALNKTLEEIGQIIFKRWFVDFEFPNQEGKPHKASGGAMVYNKELEQDIPRNWKVGCIEDVAKVIGGGTPSTEIKDYFTSNGIPWLTPKDLSGYKGKFIEKGSLDITERGLKNSSAKLMPKGTILFSSRAPIGYMAIALNDIATNQGFKSLVPKGSMNSDYLYYFMRRITPYIQSISSGSTFAEVSGSTLKQIKIIIPEITVLESYENFMSPVNSKMIVNSKGTKTLTNIRDLLLPKLLSGKIRVPIDNKMERQ